MSRAAADHAECAAVLRRAGSSFALPIRLLPPDEREGTTALYAFCRRADDIVDDTVDAAAARVAIDALGDQVHDALGGAAVDDPVVRALAATVRRWAIPPFYIDDILSGVRMDLERHSYATFAELDDYCGRVAGAVGLAAIHIWGFESPEALVVGRDCGLAFQLTNILRDIPEDLARGRIYLPTEDFVTAGCTPDDLRAGHIGPGFAALAALECERTRGCFARATALDQMLSTGGRRAFRAMFGVYRALFTAVRRAGTRIFTTRIRPSRPALVAAAVSELLVGPGRSSGRSLRERPAAGRVKVPGNPSPSGGHPHPGPRPEGAGDGAIPVVVIGGGLAGLAAAAALAEAGMPVTLLESRRRCGGRAASFADAASGDLVDACQHVAMGCCTNVLDLCRRTGLTDALRCDRTLVFIGPDSTRAACTPARWLPAPLHLAPLLLGMKHFTLGEKTALACGMLRLAAVRPTSAVGQTTALEWLTGIGQPEAVIRLFWQPVLESALGESIDLVSVTAARKVAVDGFLGHPQAADLWVPTAPLGALFGERLVAWLGGRGVEVRTGTAVTALERDATGRVTGVRCGAALLPCSAVILAVAWRQAARLVPDLVPAADERLTGSPITAVHLWFDRQVIDLPHAVLVGRVSQWVFRPDEAAAGGYCQVVISASRGLLGGDRERLIEAVVTELRDLFPAARSARLLEAKVVTDPTAVLSVRPGVDAVRPPASTAVPSLFLAGDWTATGWPSTMEGAVRSGRLAADALAAEAGVACRSLVADLPRGRLVRFIAGSA
jgi:squalene-associated FAD-dependent desaturase